MHLSRPGEFLIDHITRVLKSYDHLNKYKNIEKVFKSMIEKFCADEGLAKEVKSFILEMVKDIFYLHDEGKNTEQFQAYIGNEDYKNISYTNESKQHSIISSYYYLEKYINLINEKELEEDTEITLCELALRFAYVISCHHGALGNFERETFLERIEDIQEDYPKMFFNGYNEEIIRVFDDFDDNFKGITIYFLIKYAFSILVTCDFMAVHDFNCNKKLNLNIIDNCLLQNFKNRLESTKIVSGIREFEKNNVIDKELNKYRCQMFLESEKNIRNIKNDMYYLEAPTGCGKSVTSLNLALNLIDNINNKIVYVAPFTNVIEQTYKDVYKFIGVNNKDVVKVSAKDEIITEDILEDEEEYGTMNYDVDYMDSLLVNYPFSVISHVRFFNMLFGVKRKEAISLSLLANSIVILDEIQSYRNKIWIPIINYLKRYSEILNIKIVIMSATLPKLDQLLEEGSIGSLIEDRKYYFNFFKQRVDCNFDLLDKTEDVEDKEVLESILLKKVQSVTKNKAQRILIGTITRKTCNSLYNKLKDIYEDTDYEIYKIEGVTSIEKKNSIITRLKEKDVEEGYIAKKVILVATQCVEAGVDIDMNIGFKNISTLDSDEQFMGRIERNFNNKGLVYFYRIDYVGKIYKDDYRANKTLVDKENRKILETKNFDELYDDTYKWLRKYETKKYEEIKDETRELSFINVYNELKLIDDDLKINLLMLCKYRDKDQKIIDSKELVEMYESIKNNKKISYSQKQIELSKFKKEFDKFTYVINTFDFEKIDSFRDFGIYKLIEDGAKYYDLIEDGYVTNKSEVDLEKLVNSKLWW